MKISHRLFILVFITGFGYLGLALTFNKLHEESSKQNEALSQIQTLQNGLKLVKLEININTLKDQHAAIASFTEKASQQLTTANSTLPNALTAIAGEVHNDILEFNEAHAQSHRHKNQLNVLIQHFKERSKDINKNLLDHCALLESQLESPNNRVNYSRLQAINNLVSRYSTLTIENLLLDKNLPGFEANRYYLSQKITQQLSALNATTNGESFSIEDIKNNIDSLIELSQRIAIELDHYNDSQLRINIIEERITKSLIKLESELKSHIEDTIIRLDRTFKRATIILLIITLAIAIVISRSIFSPLKKLLQFSNDLSRGNYDTQLSELPNEFQEITYAFNQMVSKIKHSQHTLEKKVDERTQQLEQSNKVLRNEIIERQNVERILKEVASTVLVTKGDQYFESFTKYLTNKLGFDFAFIGMLDERSESITTISFVENGKVLPNITYPKKDTPCDLVAANKRLFFPNSIQSLFPNDQFLIDEGIESYVGAPVFDQKGNPLGLVSVLNRSPIESSEPVLPILQILVSQVGAEIERSMQDRALIISEERNRILVDHAPEAIVILNIEKGTFDSANPNAIDLFGYPKEKLLTLSPIDVSPKIQPNGQPSDEAAGYYLSKAANGEIPVFEWTHQNANGEQIECEIRLAKFPSESGNLIRGSITNISQRKKSEKEMQKLSHALAQTADAVMVTDAHGIIEYVNQATVDVTGYSREELTGNSPSILKSGTMDESFYEDMWNHITKGDTFRDIFINKRRDGTVYYEEKTITPLKDENDSIKNYVSTGKDITERIQTEQRLHHLAYHDPLTDLPNRLMLVERLEHAIENSQCRDIGLGVMFLDLDRFKNINDTLGHNIGDALLEEISKRLVDLLRTNDTVARLGGDEFAILIEWPENTNELATIAEKILSCFKEPFAIQNHELFTSTSIGISVYPQNGLNSETLLKNADVAMYRAKEQGRNCYQFYSTDLTAKAYKRLNLENKLRRALENDEFELYYQPQILRPTNIVYGLEALLRWHDPEQGLVSPVDFIPILEETGMIIQVGEWVLEQACKDHQQWQSQSPIPLLMSVNLSSKQFEDITLGAKVRKILERQNFDPRMLELEITESALMIDPKRSATLLKDLSDTGIRFAVDDFGTGYSSLSYLKQFPIHTLKIDRSFVQDITVDPDDAAIVSAVIALARSLSLDVIAEGVETMAQVKFLEQYQCHKLQGFLYSKPRPKKDCFEFLLENQGIIDSI